MGGYVEVRRTPEGRRQELAEWERDPWYGVLKELNLDLERIDPAYSLDQVKEKFGGLRYYITPSEGLSDAKQDAMDRLIGYAERDCYAIDQRLKEVEDAHRNQTVQG